MNDSFSPHADRVLSEAAALAAELGHGYLGSEHLLLGLCAVEDSAGGAILRRAGIFFSDVKDTVCRLCRTAPPLSVDAVEMTPRAGKILREALSLGAHSPGGVGTEHLLEALLEEGDSLGMRILSRLGADREELAGRLRDLKMRDEALKARTADRMAPPFCRDLTREAEEGRLDPVIGRDRELERVVQILTRRTKNNPCLVGEAGVGKTAVAEGLAQILVSEHCPEGLEGKRLIAPDLAALVAGTQYRGEFEKRLKNLVESACREGDWILFFDELHTLVGAGAGEGALDAANLLKPALSRGKIRVMGATTPGEYRRIERDPALERRFQAVTVAEPGEEDALAILKGLRERYEAHHQIALPDEALEAAVRLSARYLTQRFLPDKAIDLMDEAASRKRMQLRRLSGEEGQSREGGRRPEKETRLAVTRELLNRQRGVPSALRRNPEDPGERLGALTAEDVAATVTLWTGIPVHRLLEEEKDRLQRLEEILSRRVLGQERAVAAVSRAIRRSRTGLKDPRRPVGVFLFAGPTGVGKTELSRALAEALFGTEEHLIRVDLSEMTEAHSVSKLIGSPPGYAGSEEGGWLTERIRRAPFSVVLFDEIDKAHPDVIHLLLSLLEDGSLTDARGARADFRNAVLILTTNCGAEEFFPRPSVGFLERDSGEETEKRVGEALKRKFRPEFLNRPDEIVVFSPLTGETVSCVAEKMLSEVAARLAEKRIRMEVAPEALALLGEKGRDPVYGARPLRRLIQRWVEDGLSAMILEGSLQEGGHVTVTANGGKLVLLPKENASGH